MRTFAVLAAILLMLVIPVFAQDTEFPACELRISDLGGDLRTQIRNQDERVRNLVSAINRVNRDVVTTDKVIEQLVYWSAMADSDQARNPIEYPDCIEYQTMKRAFANMIDGVYAASGQIILILDGGLNDFQLDNVRNLLEAELEELDANISIWNLFHADLSDTSTGSVPTATPITRSFTTPQVVCPSNCTEARERGLTAQQAAACGLDRDDDGVACYGD